MLTSVSSLKACVIYGAIAEPKGTGQNAIEQPLDKSRGKVQLGMPHANTITEKKTNGSGY